MNREKLVVVLTLGIIVVGLAGMLYYYNIRPILAERGNPAWGTVKLPVGAVSEEIAIDPKGRVWISGSRNSSSDQAGYLAFLDGSTWQEFSADQVGLNPHTNGFGFDSTGRVWIVVPEGAAVYDGSSWKAYAMETSEDCIWGALAIDRSDRVWLGGEGCGVLIFHGNKWVKLQANPSISDNVSVLTVDPQGRVWVGTSQGEGLYIFDKSGWTAYPIKTIPYLNAKKRVLIRDIAFDSAGRAWIATNIGLVDVYLSAIDRDKPNWGGEIPGEYILDVETDKSNHVFAKSLEREGVMVRDRGNWKDIEEVQSIFGPPDYLPLVQSLALHPDGRVWINADPHPGSRQRLYILDYNRLFNQRLEILKLKASYRLPVVAIPALGLLVVLWLAAVLTRPVGTTATLKQISSSKWMLGWVLVNGLAWMTTAGILLIPLQWLINLPTDQFAKPFMVWMPVVGITVSVIWATSQWIGLAAVLPQAGYWSWVTFLGALAGYAIFIAVGEILLMISDAGMKDYYEVFGYILYCSFPFISGLLYFGSLWIVGSMTGKLQVQILNEIPLPIEKWARRNATNMALSGLLGPLGGIIYALASGRILRPKLFGEEVD